MKEIPLNNKLKASFPIIMGVIGQKLLVINWCERNFMNDVGPLNNSFNFMHIDCGETFRFYSVSGYMTAIRLFRLSFIEGLMSLRQRQRPI